MRIVESAIVERVSPDVQMITSINRNIGRHRPRAITTVVYAVRQGGHERWRSEVPILGHNWKDRRQVAQQQERIAYQAARREQDSIA